MKRKQKEILCMAGILIVLVLFFLGTGEKTSGGICINEVCSWNEYAIHGRDHSYDDYVELYNSSEKTVSLAGWHLSDDKDDLQKSPLPETELAPGERLLLYANGTASEESVAFRVRQEGEQIFLSDAEGNLIDAVEVPALEANTVYARETDGSSGWGRYTPTPGAANAEAQKVRERTLEEPVFSAESGFYEENFYLTISAGKDETIYYTTDGSIPTADSEVYTEPIEIRDRAGEADVYNAVQNVVANWKNHTPDQTDVDKAFVVRAIAVDQEGNYSDIKTASYFVNLEQYEDMDVLCLTADPEALFGDEGIYVTGAEYDEWYLSGEEGETPEIEYMHSGRGSEIEASVQLLESGSLMMDQDAGIRIQGEGSRGQSKKRFAVYARKEYDGSSYFDCELYPGRKTHSFFLNPQLSNVLSSNLLADRDLSLSKARKVAVFLDGEYWYTTYMLEKSNRQMLAESYEVAEDNVIIVKEGVVTEGGGADLDSYDRLFALVRDGDMTLPENYETVKQMMDVQSYIDFMCANLYLCNMDVSETHNYMVWKTREAEDSPYGDSRWRWMLYDMDFLEYIELDYYQTQSKAQIPSFNVTMPYSDGTYMTQELFAGLIRNEEFRKQFVLTFMDVANVNFAPDTVEAELEKWGEDLSWEDGFFLERFAYITEDMAESLGLEGVPATLTLEAAHGQIQVNTTMPDLSKGGWSGVYYTDYPVTLTAVPEEGYQFTGWEGDYESAEPVIEVELDEGGTFIRALFEKE